MSAAEELQACAECGATVYPEHVERHDAEMVDGRLLCSFCLQARRAASRPPPPGMGVAARPAAPKITLSSAAYKEPTYKRSLIGDSPYATRCKTFHCKMADAPIVHLNEQINEWIDNHPEVVIKFATQSVGIIEGKHNDPHLLITIFY